jgi:DNA-binding XRE family transcriptional regulator
MDKRKQRAIEAAGFHVTTVKDFLGLSEEENRIVELRVAMVQEIRRLRAQKHLTQHQLATRLKSSQSRVAKIEAGSADVSLDLMFRSFFALGGRIDDLVAASRPTRQRGTAKRSPKLASV